MYKAFFKRFLDIFGAIFLIILTSPLIILTYFLIRKNISKSTIFTQSRPGLNEKIFKIYKFKTMSDERDANGELLSDELRLNEYGKKIRALSLDEL
ncbi:MAG: sugar transferase, partial [Campylobacter sp.]|nr:sugar transferase [Campylobacter sp.]